MRKWWPILALLVLAGVSVYVARSNARARRLSADAGRSTELKQTLQTTRDAIARFHKDTTRYPYSLYELVPKYLQRVPVDPITKAMDWRFVTEERVEASNDFTTGGAAKAKSVIIDLHSSAPGKDADGRPYSEY